MQGGSITRWTWKQQREGVAEGEGNVLLAGSTGQLQWRKVAQGQVHKMPRLVFISSCRTIERRADIQHEWHIVRNNFKIERVLGMF